MKRLLLLFSLFLTTVALAYAQSTVEAAYGTDSQLEQTINDADGNPVVKIKFEAFNGGQTPVIQSDHIRFYQKNKVTFTASPGVTITEVSFTTTTSDYKLADIESNPTGLSNDLQSWNGNTSELVITKNKGGQARIKKITITYTTGPVLPSAELKYSASTCEQYFGATEYEEFPVLENPNGISMITFASSDTNVATIDTEGNVTIAGVGATTISASFDGNDQYKAGSAEYILTVVDPTATTPGGYVLLTDLSYLTDGSKGIIVSTAANVAMGPIENDKGTSVDVTIVENTISDSKTACVIEFGKSGDNYTLKTGDSYLSGASTGTDILTSNNAANFTITLDSENNNATISYLNTTSRQLLHHNSSFGNYAKSNAGKADYDYVQIYVETAPVPVEPVAAPVVSVEGAELNADKTLANVAAGQKAIITLTAEGEGTRVYYKTDGGDPVRYTAPFEVEAGRNIEYYAELKGLKSEFRTLGIVTETKPGAITTETPIDNDVIYIAADGTVTFRSEGAAQLKVEITIGSTTETTTVAGETYVYTATAKDAIVTITPLDSFGNEYESIIVEITVPETTVMVRTEGNPDTKTATVTMEVPGEENAEIYYLITYSEAPAAVSARETTEYTKYEAPFQIDRTGTISCYAVVHGVTGSTSSVEITNDILTTGIDAITVVDDGEAEYYDLNGRRAENPGTGIYIRRTGNTTVKVIIR